MLQTHHARRSDPWLNCKHILVLNISNWICRIENIKILHWISIAKGKDTQQNPVISMVQVSALQAYMKKADGKVFALMKKWGNADGWIPSQMSPDFSHQYLMYFVKSLVCKKWCVQTSHCNAGKLTHLNAVILIRVLLTLSSLFL